MSASAEIMSEPSLNVLTSEDLRQEWDYRFQERIGMMCGAAEPTGDQAIIAMQEADEAIEALKS